ncbi:MAG: transcriptional regulator NrdR [Candidatus Electryoneaceae bacterium]|nr:transcriptional regulator NrdR [Candidatus Electryoneaceae bacterium]
MKCPYCGYDDDKVVDSRPTKEESAIRRRRECLNCQRRFTTYEYVEEIALTVRKCDGKREPFDRAKLKRGIMTALAKRPVSALSIEDLVSTVEEQCYEVEDREVSSADIGEIVMERLRVIDDVAYIRFASVYRRFEDLGEFRRELDQM